MADYKRMVSYIYSYDNGVKMNNVGFAKLEERNEQLKITINIKNVHIINSKTYKVYLFERGESEEIKGILLGELTTRNNSGEFKGVADSSNIMNSRVSFKNCVGMIIENGTEKAYATGWDDKPIKISKLRVDIVKAEKEVNVSIEDAKEEDENEPFIKTEEEKNIYFEEIEKDEENEFSKFNKETYSDIAMEELSKDIVNEAKIKMEEESFEKALSDNIQEASVAAIESDNYNSMAKETLLKTEENIYGKQMMDYKFNQYIIPKQSFDEKPSEFQNKDKVNKERLHASEAGKKDIIENEFFNNYTKLYPFEDDEIFECIRIEPQDIGLLPMETWILGNNSFLLHGYYNYKHLILGKIRMNVVKNENSYRYILGVPGVYSSREKFLAKMFGFEHFKTTKTKEQKTGEFGYWYMFVNL